MPNSNGCWVAGRGGSPPYQAMVINSMLAIFRHCLFQPSKQLNEVASYPHSIDKETEPQRGEITYGRPGSWYIYLRIHPGYFLSLPASFPPFLPLPALFLMTQRQ